MSNENIGNHSSVQPNLNNNNLPPCKSPPGLTLRHLVGYVDKMMDAGCQEAKNRGPAAGERCHGKMRMGRTVGGC